MSTPTVRINEASHQVLKALAEQTGQTMMEVLDKALDAYRRKLFFEQLNAGYAEPRADPEAWAEHLAERKPWDATPMDRHELASFGSVSIWRAARRFSADTGGLTPRRSPN